MKLQKLLFLFTLLLCVCALIIFLLMAYYQCKILQDISLALFTGAFVSCSTAYIIYLHELNTFKENLHKILLSTYQDIFIVKGLLLHALDQSKSTATSPHEINLSVADQKIKAINEKISLINLDAFEPLFFTRNVFAYRILKFSWIEKILYTRLAKKTSRTYRLLNELKNTIILIKELRLHEITIVHIRWQIKIEQRCSSKEIKELRQQMIDSLSTKIEDYENTLSPLEKELRFLENIQSDVSITMQVVKKALSQSHEEEFAQLTSK